MKGTNNPIQCCMPDLVLLVFQKSFQSNGNDFDHILHGVVRCVQKSDGEEALLSKDIEICN